MASKNNPNRKQKAEETSALTKATFYGFNLRFWCASSAPNIEEARLDIRRQMGVKKSEKFTVKPM